MSDTPRTDDALLNPAFDFIAPELTVTADFARGLERELNEANTRIRNANDYLERTILINCGILP